MADESSESNQSSRSRRVDLNLCLGLPALPRRRGRDLGLDLALNCPSPIPHSCSYAEEGEVVRGPGRPLSSSALGVYSPSNALSTPEPITVDPLFEVFNGVASGAGDQFDAVLQVMPSSDASSRNGGAGESRTGIQQLLGWYAPSGIRQEDGEAGAGDQFDTIPPVMPASDSSFQNGSAGESRTGIQQLLGMYAPSGIRPEDGEAVAPVGRVETALRSELSSHEGRNEGEAPSRIRQEDDDTVSPVGRAETVLLSELWSNGGRDQRQIPSRIRHEDGEAVPLVGRVEMVRLSELSSHGGSDWGQPREQIEAEVPELRLRRLIQVSEQHRIVPSSGAGDRRGTSPDTDRLMGAIMQSQSALVASRKRKLDSDADHKKEKGCECGADFECNICFEKAKEPVVTQCGHLFCWPCLYQWLYVQAERANCPVCKGDVFEANVTPIYGSGSSRCDASSADIPPRPHASMRGGESLRHQLQRSSRSLLWLLAEQEAVRARGEASPQAPEGFTVVHPAARPRVRVPRNRREGRTAVPSSSSIVLQLGNATVQIPNEATLPASDAPNAQPWAPWSPPSSSADRASTSSTMAFIAGDDQPADNVTVPARTGGVARRTRRRLH